MIRQTVAKCEYCPEMFIEFIDGINHLKQKHKEEVEQKIANSTKAQTNELPKEAKKRTKKLL